MLTDLDAFMATMVARSSPVPIEQVVALAREHYGLKTQARRLTGERDENFALRTEAGSEYVLKIANAAEEALLVDLTTAALLHIERSDPDIPVPRVVRTRTGGVQFGFMDQNGIGRTARVLTYLPGTLLAETARSPAQRAACGRMAGRLAKALYGFSHRAAQRAVVWDVRHVAYAGKLLGELPELAHRPLASEMIERIAPRVDAQLPRQRQQVVHADTNPRNVLVDPAQASRVIGIIDFGDLTRTALIADVAVAAAELIPESCAGTEGARDAVRDVANAYHEVVPLLPQELALLPTLVAARLFMNVVVHEWHVSHNRDNDHHAALEADFILARLTLAGGLLTGEIGL